MKLSSVLLNWIWICAVRSAGVSHVVHERRNTSASEWTKVDDQTDANEPFRLSIALAQQNLAFASKYLMDVSDPGSVNYGKHWTTQEVGSACLVTVLSMGIMLAVLFVTPDFAAASTSVTGFPFMDIFTSALGLNFAMALIIVVSVVNIFSVNSLLATASRTLWAFSRENGLPFSSWLVKVHPKTRLPINANLASIGINVLLALISVGSTAAYQAFFSSVIAAYYSSFFIAACVMLNKRLTTSEADIPWGPFRLGRMGVPITLGALPYTLLAVFFSFWPSVTPVTAVSMNYASLVFGGFLLIALGFWYFHGHRVYIGPIWEFDEEYRRIKRVVAIPMSSLRKKEREYLI